MIIIDLDYTDFSQFLNYLSGKLNAEIKNNRLELPDSFGKGYLELIELPNGLQALVSSMEYHQDVLYSRKHKDDYYFVLHFNDMQLSGAINFTMQGKELRDENQYRAGAALTSSLFEMSYTVKAGSIAKSINVLLKKDWLATYLDHGDVMKMLANYIMLKNTLIHPEPFDAEYRMLFDEIFDFNNTAPLQSMMVKNRIMLLLERFLSKLYRNIVNLTPEKQGKIKTADLGKLMEIEALLVKDFSQAPPTIAMLAEKAGMSISKLKSVFKKVYGTGIYEYYQKNRMQKARSMLLTDQYTVKEVGLQLGYTNLSNFSLAFKKEFGVLPSQL